MWFNRSSTQSEWSVSMIGLARCWSLRTTKLRPLPTNCSTGTRLNCLLSDKVVALYPYTAANPDELSFLKDDIISVTAREEAAWWRGELNGVSGLFPSNYVAPLQSQCKCTPFSLSSNISQTFCHLQELTPILPYKTETADVHTIAELVDLSVKNFSVHRLVALASTVFSIHAPVRQHIEDCGLIFAQILFRDFVLTLKKENAFFLFSCSHIKAIRFFLNVHSF